MEMYQQDLQSEQKSSIWLYVFLIIVVGVIVFLFVRYKDQPQNISDNEKEQILQDLRDSRQSGPTVQLTEEQKVEILNNLQSLRQAQTQTLSDEQKAEILSQFQVN